MKFTVSRESLIRPLQQVAGVVERRQTLPVLANVLLRVEANQLSVTGTDLEVEMVSRIPLEGATPGEVTVPARKLVDICRELGEDADIKFELVDQKVSLRAGRFKSTLSTLPASEFPNVDTSETELSVTVPPADLKQLLERTGFAMAQQDVRYFLNGMLLEVGGDKLRSVSTDGHRLAMATMTLEEAATGEQRQVIVPRKGILELQRLLGDIEEPVRITIGGSHLCVHSGTYTLTTKLIDGRFPDYDRVVPRNGDKTVFAQREELRHALNRTAILSNEKFRGIRVQFSAGNLQLSANNPDQEEAEEEVSIEYDGQDVEIGFNVSYLQDVLSVLEGEKVKLTLHDANSSAVIEGGDNQDAVYVVMPMKL